MAAQPDALQMKRRKQVVYSSNPLRHTHVVGIFRLEQELENSSGKQMADCSIGAQLSQRWIPVSDEPEPRFLIDSNGFGSSVHRFDQVIVEIWRPHRHLGLLQVQYTVVVPR